MNWDPYGVMGKIVYQFFFFSEVMRICRWCQFYAFLRIVRTCEPVLNYEYYRHRASFPLNLDDQIDQKAARANCSCPNLREIHNLVHSAKRPFQVNCNILQINLHQWFRLPPKKKPVWNWYHQFYCIYFSSNYIIFLYIRYTHRFTINGWFISANMLFSFFTCSTCLSRITSAIANIFMAQNVLFVLSWHKHTRPNVPVPAIGNKK